MLKIIFFGDIYGRPGREALKKYIPIAKKKYDPDFVMANGENMAHGSGVTRSTLEECQSAGVEFFTSGNHIFSKKEAIELLEKKEPVLIRPANYPEGVPGTGYQIIQIRTQKLAVINIMGRVFIREDLDDPFAKIETILSEIDPDVKNIFVDFHTEATSEFIAMRYFLDGKVSAIVGTHTHVPTQDFHVSEAGTFSVTDVGMTGPANSVLGVDASLILAKFRTQMPTKHEVAETDQAEINAVYLEIDSDGKVAHFEKIYEFIDM